MEVKINVNVTLDASPNLTALVLTALCGRAPQASQEWDTPEKTATPMGDLMPAAQTPAASTSVTPAASTSVAPVKPLTQPETATPAPETAAAAAAETGEYKERPENVLPLLCQRFGIPENKEDRTEEQKAMAKGLNKAVREVIRDVTKNTAARAISDLRTDEDRRAFVEGALLITYNAESGEFSAMPF